MRPFLALWDGLLSLLFPRAVACACCAKPLSGDPQADPLCDACKSALVIALPHAHTPPDPLHFSSAAFAFHGPARTLVHRFKYNGLIRLAPFLAHAMRPLVPPSVDCLVPIPLHPRRQRTRGFNQSEALARAIHALGGPPCLCALTRTRFTHQQARLSRAARRSNVQDSMQCLADVRAKHILIIDDVYTTGATAAEAAHTLLQAGASWVGVLTYAQAISKPTRSDAP